MKHSTLSLTRKNSGFTLVELMISITLGLLVVAAASQLFVAGFSSYNLQRGVADVQDSGGFGLEYIARDIRLANLNAPSSNNSAITSLTPYSGIVLTNGTPTSNLPLITTVTPLTGAGAANSASTTTTTTSDQLVIEFSPQADGVDCEGTPYLLAANQYVVQQYFVRNDVLTIAGEPNSLALVCRAGRLPITAGAVITYDNPTCTNNCGQIIITRVDYFHVLLEVNNSALAATPYRYISAPAYTLLPTPPQIQAVQLAVLARSLTTGGNNSQVNLAQTYPVLDQVVVPSGVVAGSRYVRQVFTATVALRNGLG
jgi:type IV pilus assembly protein PilW